MIFKKARLDIPLAGYLDCAVAFNEAAAGAIADNTEKQTHTKMKNILTSIIAISACSFVAVAADEAKPAAPAAPAAAAAEGKKGARRAGDPEAAFKKLDSNSDGSVSLDEFKAGPLGKKDPAKAEEIFKKRDKDSDGKLSKEEMAGGHAKKAK